MAEALYSGKVLPGGFRLLDPLGEGAFSWVWLAEEIGTGRRFALKVARSEEHLSLLRRQAATPSHDHIAEVVSLQDHEAPFYLVMEHVDGASLRAVLDQCPKGLKLGAAIRLFRQVLLALDVAHAEDKVHGDLKPENVLVTRDRRVKVTDFGVIQSFEDATLRHSLVTGRSVHSEASGAAAALAPFTPLYVAPELRGGSTPCTRAGDIYALGIILHELTTGRPPQGADLPSTLRPSLPRWVDEAFQRTYTGEARRIGSVAELRDFVDREVERQADRDARRTSASGADFDIAEVRRAADRQRRPPPLPAIVRAGEPLPGVPGLVIAGLLLSLCCPLVGLILCELGRHEALRRGQRTTLATLGIAISLVILGVELFAFLLPSGTEVTTFP